MSEEALRRARVLAYHGVGDVDDAVDPRRLVMSAADLESHIRLLRRLGFRFATVEELLDEDGASGRTAALTFDDGWSSSLTHAVPVLARHGVRATFYVCPGWWGRQHPDVEGEAGRLLDEDGARALVAAGMELGSHTLTHPDLTRLGDAELDRELVESRSAVEAIIGRPCRTLAYPFGSWDGRVARAAEAAGYELAFAWRPGGWERFAAPRLQGPPRHGAGRLLLKLLGVRRRAA
jgi:peptidoglycan/xylan/chitin deacetylase (PgdA/CDA1 family)